MENLEFPKQLKTSLYNCLHTATSIDTRVFPIEKVHEELVVIAKTLKKLLVCRKEFLETNNISITNLISFSHSRTLNADGCVLIQVQEHILPIKISEGCKIENNFDSARYSINKVNNKQEIYHSSNDDYALHKLIYLYQELNKRYKYKVGNRIHLKIFEGMYKIVAMDHDSVTISCNKWKTLGKPNKKVKLEDVKCLAGGYNNLEVVKW